MNEETAQNKRSLSDRLHPTVYTTMALLALWLVLSVWGFAGEGYTDWLLVVVSGFIFIVVALQFVLSRVGRGGAPAGQSKIVENGAFREWISGEFETWQDRVKGRNAAIEVLLPIAAVAFGMTAFALIFLLVMHSVGGAT